MESQSKVNFFFHKFFIIVFSLFLLSETAVLFSCKDDDDENSQDTLKCQTITSSPSNITVTQSETKINTVNISWDAAESESDISYYRVFYYYYSGADGKTKNQSYSGNVTSTSREETLSIPFDGDKITCTYYFYVTAYTKSDSKESETISCELTFNNLSCPENLEHYISGTTHTFLWSKVDSADKYIIYGRYLDEKDGRKVYYIKLAETSDTRTSINTGETQYSTFYIRAGQKVKSSGRTEYYTGNLTERLEFPDRSAKIIPASLTY